MMGSQFTIIIFGFDMKIDISSFSWEEVECFIRPQSVIANLYKPGLGTCLLLLSSLYRSNGYEGYFQSEDKLAIPFSKNVLSKHLPLEYNWFEYTSYEGALNSLIENNSGTTIVPANIKSLPYYEGYNEVDWAHYFLVERYIKDKDIFLINDNLHLGLDSKSKEYRPFVLEANKLNEMMKLYEESHVAGGYLYQNAYYKFSRYWNLNMQYDPNRDDSEETIDHNTLLELFLTIYRKYVSNTRPAELFYLTRLFEERHESDLRHYLMSVNQRSLYIKIIKKALEQRAYFKSSERTDVDYLISENNALHTMLMIKLHRKLSISREEVEDCIYKVNTIIRKIDEELALAACVNLGN